MFTEKFNGYVCVGDSIALDLNGFTVAARIEHDGDVSPDDFDCYSEADTDAWKNNEWFFCGVSLSISKNGITLDKHAASLWGVEANLPESDNSYLNEVANELLPEALEAGREALQRLCAA